MIKWILYVYPFGSRNLAGCSNTKVGSHFLRSTGHGSALCAHLDTILWQKREQVENSKGRFSSGQS